MLITNNIIIFKNFFIKIPNYSEKVKDLSENRWGYKIVSR